LGLHKGVELCIPLSLQGRRDKTVPWIDMEIATLSEFGLVTGTLHLLVAHAVSVGRLVREFVLYLKGDR
jgi:hypothetical protein